MTPRDRVLATFDGRTTDLVPVAHGCFSGAAASQVLGREAYMGGGIQHWREAQAWIRGPDAVARWLDRSLQDAYDLGLATGQDVLNLHIRRLPDGPPRRQLDDYTFLFGDPSAEHRIMRYDPATERFRVLEWSAGPRPRPMLDDLRRRVAELDREAAAGHGQPDAARPWRDLMARFGGSHALRLGGTGLAIPPRAVWGEATRVDPHLLARYLDLQRRAAIRTVDSLGEAGVCLNFGAVDRAGPPGLACPLDLVGEFVLPAIRAISDAGGARGVHHLFALGARFRPLSADLCDRGGIRGCYDLDGGAGIELRRLRRQCPDLVLFGNISADTLQRGTPQQVVAQTRDCLSAARELGRIIVGCWGPIAPRTPPENLRAMLQTLERER